MLFISLIFSFLQGCVSALGTSIFLQSLVNQPFTGDFYFLGCQRVANSNKVAKKNHPKSHQPQRYKKRWVGSLAVSQQLGSLPPNQKISFSLIVCKDSQFFTNPRPPPSILAQLHSPQAQFPTFLLSNPVLAGRFASALV